MTSLSREQVRRVDRRAIEDFHLPGIVLMENAGRGCADLLRFLGITGRVVICCGKGNNGGDGFVIARHLDNAGVDVEVLVFAPLDEITGDAGINLAVVQASGIPLQSWSQTPRPLDLDRHFADADWIVDALLGTGFQGEIREPFRTVIAAVNRASGSVLAVDLPSGLDCDTGFAGEYCVRASHTATLVARKRGFENPASVEFTGIVHVIEIGVPVRLLTSPGP